jgi:hypothetical protein
MIPNAFDGNYGRYLIGWKDGYTRYAHDGVALPDEVLEKIYYKNAEKLFGISVAEWKPETPVSFETRGAWQDRPAAPSRRSPGPARTEDAPAQAGRYGQ